MPCLNIIYPLDKTFHPREDSWSIAAKFVTINCSIIQLHYLTYFAIIQMHNLTLSAIVPLHWFLRICKYTIVWSETFETLNGKNSQESTTKAKTHHPLQPGFVIHVLQNKYRSFPTETNCITDPRHWLLWLIQHL